MTYNHLTIEERACVYQFKLLGMGIREIARAIGRNASTISRELKRNGFKTGYKYHPVNAQKKYNERRKKSHRKVSITPEIKKYIEEKIKLTWSPEQIAKRKGNIKMPSFSTIYHWIHKKLIDNVQMIHLRRKGKFKRPQETRGRFNIGKTIKKRPKDVYKRNSFGHWEADTVESGRINHQRKSKYCFVTLAERKSRLYVVKLLPDRTEANVTKAIIEILSQYPKELVKTITCDRGKEFAGYEKIEKELKCNMYFADSYCAWQKGTNENSNGLLREFYPKGMDLSKTNDDEVTYNLSLINNRPRKCNNFLTPNELINDYINKCCA